jgi:hypothetical protein
MTGRVAQTKAFGFGTMDDGDWDVISLDIEYFLLGFWWSAF